MTENNNDKTTQESNTKHIVSIITVIISVLGAIITTIIGNKLLYENECYKEKRNKEYLENFAINYYYFDILSKTQFLEKLFYQNNIKTSVFIESNNENYCGGIDGHPKKLNDIKMELNELVSFFHLIKQAMTRHI